MTQISILIVAIVAWLAIFPASTLAAHTIGGKATVYSDKYQGKKTASGQRYNSHLMTAASSTLPLGSKVQVRNKSNGRMATVRINDRKAHGGAQIDLSKSAAHKLGVNGTAAITGHVLK